MLHRIRNFGRGAFSGATEKRFKITQTDGQVAYIGLLHFLHHLIGFLNGSEVDGQHSAKAEILVHDLLVK